MSDSGQFTAFKEALRNMGLKKKEEGIDLPKKDKPLYDTNLGNNSVVPINGKRPDEEILNQKVRVKPSFGGKTRKSKQKHLTKKPKISSKRRNTRKHLNIRR